MHRPSCNVSATLRTLKLIEYIVYSIYSWINRVRDRSTTGTVESATLPTTCRAAVYTAEATTPCIPTAARPSDFPVTPGTTMPPVRGCKRQDYAVLFVVEMT